ncbi:hypothetical protein K502DRAFT_326887 [Neoconidiobolus thromboides FSU 785]|nr:hypothetical protein K502DRAFT_326887 [Neoconidiobolus thromboides FSU 785]
MDCYYIIQSILETLPTYHYSLGSLTAELQNFCNQKKLSKHEISTPPTRESVLVLIKKVIKLMDIEEKELFIGCSRFLYYFIPSLSLSQLGYQEAKWLAGRCFEMIQSFENTMDLELDLEDAVNRLLSMMEFLFVGDERCIARLNKMDLIVIIDMITEYNTIKPHWLLKKYWENVESYRSLLKEMMFSMDFNYLYISEYSKYTEDYFVIIANCPTLFVIMKERITEEKFQNPEDILVQLLQQKSDWEKIELKLNYFKIHLHINEKQLLLKAYCRLVQWYLFNIQKKIKEEKGDIIDISLPEDKNQVLIPNENQLIDWQYIQQLAEYCYYFVSINLITLNNIIDSFLELIQENSITNLHNTFKIKKDNSLLWIILQLFHLPNLKEEINQDFLTREIKFQKLIKLYSPNQIYTQQRNYYRDLALQCMIQHQQKYLTERNNMKYRLPQLIPVLKFATLTYKLHKKLMELKEIVENTNTFHNINQEELLNLSIAGQSIQNELDRYIYINLVPTKNQYDKLLIKNCTYVNGGMIDYKLIEFLTINGKQFLLNLIFAMCLNCQKGPQTFNNTKLPPTCTSPPTLDTVYKIIYADSWNSEQNIKGMLETLKYTDFILKGQCYNILQGTSQNNNNSISPVVLRWQYSILQLINHRLGRYFFNYRKYNLLLCGQYSLISQKEERIYLEIELMMINFIIIQKDVKSLENYLLQLDAKSNTFFEDNLLLNIITKNKLIQLIEMGEYSRNWNQRMIMLLNKLGNEKAMSSKLGMERIKNETIKKDQISYYEFKEMNSLNEKKEEFEEIKNYLTNKNLIIGNLNEISIDSEYLIQFFIILEHQKYFLCYCWLMLECNLNNIQLEEFLDQLIDQIYNNYNNSIKFQLITQLLMLIINNCKVEQELDEN